MSTDPEPDPGDDLTRRVPAVGRRRCAPGDWYAVLAPHASVLLPPEGRDRVSGTWDLADRGAGFDELLDHVVSDGLAGLPGLAVVGALEGGRVRLLLRGPVRARVQGSTGNRLLAAEAESWSDRSLEDVRALSLDVDGTTAAPELSVGTGIARVGRLELGGVGADVGVPERRLAPVPPPRGPAPAAGPGRPTLTLAPGPAAGPAARPASTAATLVFSTGAVVPVDRPVVVGRAPRGSNSGVSAAEDSRLVAVPSPRLEISATHLVVRPDPSPGAGAAVLVTDLASTNGTLLLRAGQAPQELVPGLATRLVPGDVLDLGEGVTMRAQRP